MSKKFWFITSVRENTAYREDGSSYKYQDSRCWGFFEDKEKAIKAVEENWTDMNEADCYPYAVIESISEGLLTVANNPEETIWFKAIYKDRKFVKYEITEQPEFAKRFVSWTI